MTPTNDETKIPMDVYNAYRVVKAKDADLACNINPQVHPFIAELLTKLSAKRPTWEFICNTRRIMFPGGVAASNNYNEFKIYDGDELLGYVTREWRHHGDSYVFNNERILATKVRCAPTATKDVDKAAKLILKHFYVQSNVERMGAVLRSTTDAVNTLLVRYEHEFKHVYSKVANRVQQYALDNWDEVQKHLPGMDDQLRAMVPTSKAELERARGVHYAHKNFHGATVHVVGKAYLVSYGQDPTGQVHTYTTATLPAALKGSVGMLKLIQPQEYVESVGMRVDENTFFVMLEGKVHVTLEAKDHE